jgi:hypothetical protein
VVPDADRIEAVSQGDDGKPLGGELQIAGVLSSLKKPGEIAIDGHSGELTTRLRDFSGKVLYTVGIPAQC